MLALADAMCDLYWGEVYIPGKHGHGVSLRGPAGAVMSLALLAGVVHLGSLVADHYDRRSNEDDYQIIARVTKYMFWGLFILAYLVRAATAR